MKKYEHKNLEILELKVIKAKNNDKESKEYIINFFQPFIIKLSKTTFIKNMNEEDIKQHLILSLLIAIEKYSGNNKFFWYAIQTMKNNIYLELKKIKREDGYINIDKLSISDNYNIDDELLKKEELQELNENLHKLNEADYDLIIKSFFLSYDLNSLAKHFHISYTNVSTRKNRAIKKLKLLM